MDEYLSLSKIMRIMSDKGCKRVLAKNLSENDNSKNQVYFGSGFESLNLFPVKSIYPVPGKPHFKAALEFYWLDSKGLINKAPGAQLILYPQYPEVRFSGFLKGCQNSPSSLMNNRLPGRLMFLGVRDDGSILGYVVPLKSPAAREFRAGSYLMETDGVFIKVPATREYVGDSVRHILITRLREIHQMKWLDPVRLAAGGKILECRGSNCGGYTLEAYLGIRSNANSEPDFMGWEIKQHGVRNFDSIESGVITLMTPEPQAGYYRDRGVIPFVMRYGYKDQSGREDRMNFGGIHVANTRSSLTGLSLILNGYDVQRSKIIDNRGGLDLVDIHGNIAARWFFADLMSHWNRKHNLAAYVPSLVRSEPRTMYSYGSIIRMGEGTDFMKFLSAVAERKIYYDPGIKVENISSKRPRTKRRSQFRIKSKDISVLYNKLTRENVLSD